MDASSIVGFSDKFGSSSGSPLDRLAAAIFVNSDDPGSRLMAMFSANFDASGNPNDHPYIVVSGYIANYLQWQRFESDWVAVHNAFGLDLPFHMSEFNSARTNVKYKEQDKARTDYVEIAKHPERIEEFVKKISQLQMSFALTGVSCIVPMAIYREIDSLLNLSELLPPYALGARMCIQKVRNWEKTFNVTEPVECVFETGDFGQGHFSKLMVDEGEDPPIYKKKKDILGLQAADHYAWEQFNVLRKHSRQSGEPVRRACYFLLESIPKLHTHATRDFLIRLCELKGIDPRTGFKK